MLHGYPWRWALCCVVSLGMCVYMLGIHGDGPYAAVVCVCTCWACSIHGNGPYAVVVSPSMCVCTCWAYCIHGDGPCTAVVSPGMCMCVHVGLTVSMVTGLTGIPFTGVTNPTPTLPVAECKAVGISPTSIRVNWPVSFHTYIKTDN